MELPDLLAREGYDPKNLPGLLSWARARADALVRGLDPGTPLGALLEGFSRHVPKDSSFDALDLDVEEDAPADLRRAVAAATAALPIAAAPIAATPEPAVVDDDPDSGFGGFARFGALMRMNRPYPFRQQETVVEERPPARSVELEDESPPPPPTPAPASDLSATLPLAALGFSAEESGGLVLGIPDEDASESSGLTNLFDPSAGPDIVESPPPVEHRPSRPSGPVRRVTSIVVDDDDDFSAALGLSAPPTVASQLMADDTIAEPLRTRDTPPMPGLPAVEPDHDPAHDPGAPVLRHRNPKKKVVELSAPVGRPRSTAPSLPAVNPKLSTPKGPRKSPPPPPSTRRVAPVEEDIQELSRVELIEDLPSYLRDDDE